MEEITKKDKLKEYNKNYYKNNKDKFKYKKEDYQEHSDTRKESSRKHYENKRRLVMKENYAKKKEEEYKLAHGGSLEGFKGVREQRSKYDK